MTAEEFNQTYSVGTSVNYHPVIGRPEFVRTHTRSEAMILPGNQHVVMIEGKGGCVALEAISIDPEVAEYIRLGLIAEHHSIDCACADCAAFLAQGDKCHARGLHA